MSAAPHDLQSFLRRLRAEGELVEIRAEVNADLEVAEIHRRVIAANGPALLFTNVRGAAFPLVTNLFGSARRVSTAFGSHPEETIAAAARLPETLLPPTPTKLFSERKLLARLSRIGLRQRRKGPVTEVVTRKPDLTRLPILKTWERDAGPFITLPLVYTEPVGGGPGNLGMYRAQVFEDNALGLHFQIGKGGGFHLSDAHAQERPLPVNLHVGGPPALMLAAVAPLPENAPELLLASLALGKRLAMCRNPAGPLPLIAEAEFCMVGQVQPGASRPEGPFGDHYGYYSECHDYPFMHVDAMFHRRNAVFPATVVGKPRQEDFFLGDYLQELLSPLFPVVMPAVRDLWSYGETGYHALSAAIVHERYKREAMASAFRILGEGQLSLTKFLLVTDCPVDLHDFPATLRHILCRADFRTDLFVFANLSMDSLDYAGPQVGEGSKGVLLGIGEPRRNLPSDFQGSVKKPVREVRVFTDGCLVVDGPTHAEDPDAGTLIAQDPAFADWPLVVLVDDAEQAARSTTNFLWTTFTRFNPASNIHARSVELIQHHASFTAPIVIDSRMKANYPEELFCDDSTHTLVGRRWKEYFPGGGVEMGDSALGHLD
jgi:UbiD family decarboxylase